MHWLALLIIVLATIIETWPIAGQIGTHIPGSEGDAWEHFWVFEWVKGSLFQESELFYTDTIFYPQGTSLETHNFAWVNIAFWLVLEPFFGPGSAYSLMMLAVFIFNGFAVYLFVYELTERFSAAMTAGVIAAFWPHILSHHDHPNLIVTAWVSLTLLAVFRLMRSGQSRYAILAGIFLALVGLTRWQTLVLGGVVIGFYLLYLFFSEQSVGNRKDRLVSLSLMIGAAVILMLPLFLAQFSQAAGLGKTITGVLDGNAAQTDLLAYILPNRFHPWWGAAAFDRFYGPLQTSKVFTPFLGYVTLALVVMGLVWKWRRTRFWLGLAVVYLLLALGPVLLVNGRSYIPLPYQIIESTFLGALIRSPDRFNVFLSLPAAVLAGFGMVGVLDRARLKRPMKAGITALVAILILVEYAVQYPTFAINDYPAWYYSLAQETGEFAILELPISDRSFDEFYMHYQLLHGKPIVGGSIARISEETFGFIKSLPMLDGMPEQPVPPENVVNVGSQLTALAQANVKYLVFHKKFMGEDQLQIWRDWLTIPAYHEDEEVLVYQTDWVVGQSLPYTPLLDNGLGVISADIQPTSTTQDGWVEVAVQWGTAEALSETYEVCFLLERSSGEIAADSCFPVSTDWPTDLWSQNEMVADTYLVHMSPYLTSDRYTIRAEIRGIEDSQSVMVGSVDFSALPRTFSNTDEVDIIANWDNQIGLMDFSVNQTAAYSFDVEVEWIAQQRMEQSYQVFVHLLDSETLELVSQVDTVPLDWGYPTNWWEQGELISDTLHLSLPLSGSGAYEVWLGWYSLGTNIPLPVIDSAAQFSAEENRIRLGQLIVDNEGFIE